MRYGIFPHTEMKLSDSHSFSTIDSIDCELSVVPDWLGEKVKTVARIKIRTYTAIMPPTMRCGFSTSVSGEAQHIGK